VSLSGECLDITPASAAPKQVCAPTGSHPAAGLGLVAVERGSGWYIDPYRTALDDLDRVVAGTDVSALLGQLGAGGPGPLAWYGLPAALGSSASGCTASGTSSSPCPAVGLLP
jgi:hypothetical protein